MGILNKQVDIHLSFEDRLEALGFQRLNWAGNAWSCHLPKGRCMRVSWYEEVGWGKIFVYKGLERIFEGGFSNPALLMEVIGKYKYGNLK